MALHQATFYPRLGVRKLRSRGGQRWAELVDWVSTLDGTDPHVMALTLTLRRLRFDHRLSHELCSDPFCALCASQIVESFEGSENDLLELYYQNLEEINAALKTMRLSRAVDSVTAA